MGLEFIIGAASADREMPLVEKAQAWLDANDRHEVFYLVPNHIKFETEVSVLKKLEGLRQQGANRPMASLNLQIFSFTRLAWYYLQNESCYQEEQLSDASHLMLIRKVLLEVEDQLKIFKGEVRQSGFIQQVADLFHELASGKLESTDLSELIQGLGSSAKEQDLKGKLAEFQLIYDAYLERLAGRPVGLTQHITQLAAYLPTIDLSNVMIVVTGFSRFTAKERELIETLISHAAEVKINLILDKSYYQELPESHSMFFDAGKVYFDLYHYARQNHIKIYQDTRLHPDLTTDLGRLDQFWVSSQQVGGSSFPTALTEDKIQIKAYGDSYSEMSGVAREIRRLVATGDYRYRDIELLTRDMEIYEKVIAPVFNSHGIPFDTNNELSMKHHPLIELLTSLFAIQKNHYRYNDIMRFLRTELIVPVLDIETPYSQWQASREEYREKIDLTENVSLAYGYQGHYWTQEKDWLYVTYDYQDGDVALDSNLQAQADSNAVRRDVKELLVPFFKKLKQAQTGREGATILYEFLVQAGVERELTFWRNHAIAAGELEEGKAHEQTWQALMGLLDDYVMILGEDPFDFSEFITIITTGLEGLNYGKVPATLDQVTLSSIDMIHEQKNKVTFMIGMTDQTFPKKIENKTLLSDDERQLVEGHLSEGKFLSKQVKADLIKEPYIAYLAFHSTGDRLYLSYPKGIDGKKDINVSPYLTILAKGLGCDVTRETPVNPQVFDEEKISTYRSYLSLLLRLKQRAMAGEGELALEYIALEKQLLKQPGYEFLSNKLFASLTAKNIPEPLRPELVDALYGSTVRGSVSKIENFNSCHYKYFMTYGLNLKERSTFELSPAAAGDFYHDALDQLFKVLIREQLVLSELTTEELTAVTTSVLDEVLTDSRFDILKASPRMAYIQRQLRQTIERVSQTLREQSLRTGMSTVQTEVIFGQIAQKTGLDGLEVKLSNNKSLDIRGKIDRLDQIRVGQDDYLAVVDYKSSNHSFDYRDAYFGLTMQMITYLDVALQNAAKLVGSEKAKPAGAFYLQVKNPIIDGTTPEDKLTETRLKEFTYKGILLEDPALLDRLDHTLEESRASSIYPYKEKKDGSYSSTDFVSETAIDQLIKRNRENFKEAGEAIFAGSTALNPAKRDQQRLACQFCQYRSICQFDVQLKENNYHQIDNLKKKDVLEKLSKDETDQLEGGTDNDK